MNPTEDHIAAQYQDGRIAQDIEHFLMMRLHEFNTISEVELLKMKIHQMMMDMYFLGQARASDD